MTISIDMRPKADKEILDRHETLLSALAGRRRPGVPLSAEFAPAATYARGKTYFIAIALPGFGKTRLPAAGDLVVKVVQRQIEVQIKDTSAGVAGRRGRPFGTFTRTFPLPAGANVAGIKARYTKRVLTVAVPLLEFHPLTR